MKFVPFALLFLALISCENKYKEVVNSEADYPIIPKPQHLEISNGRFLINGETKIVATEALQQEAEYLKGLLSPVAQVEMTIGEATSGQAQNAITLTLDDTIEAEEGYTLDADYLNITIKGKNTKGVFYGIQSLRQLLPAAVESQGETLAEVTIPAVHIADNPRYQYRGMHLDVGRHFFSVDFIKRYIDMIAMHKMNTFHWHLTEDQGWRIEIKKYPKLTEVGAFRKETILEKNFDPYVGDGKPYGGFYTQDQIKEVVAYATSKHVTIIPEIELPGHSLAALAAYPEYGNDTGPYEVGTKWGVYEQIYAPKEETFAFLEDVLTEVIDLFPGEYIHIGGDEAPKTEWKKSKQAQEVIKREGLKDEHELQSYFITRIEKFLNSKEKQIIGWDEILEGGLAPNATVMSWRGIEGGIEAAKQHHNVVMTPGSHCYFDHYQSQDKENEPLAIGGFTSVEKVYSYEPTPDVLTEEQGKYVTGAQGNVWTEYMKTTDYVEYMVLPRMSALSEVVWSAAKDRDWDNFKGRLGSLAKRYDALGYNYAKHVFESAEKKEGTATE